MEVLPSVVAIDSTPFAVRDGYSVASRPAEGRFLLKHPHSVEDRRRRCDLSTLVLLCQESNRTGGLVRSGGSRVGSPPPALPRESGGRRSPGDLSPRRPETRIAA